MTSASSSDESYVADTRRVQLLQELQRLRGGIGHAQYKTLTQLPLFYLGDRQANHKLDLAKLQVVTEETGLVAGLFGRGPDGTMPGDPSLYAENVDNILNRLHRRLQILDDTGKLLQPRTRQPEVRKVWLRLSSGKARYETTRLVYSHLLRGGEDYKFPRGFTTVNSHSGKLEVPLVAQLTLMPILEAYSSCRLASLCVTIPLECE